MNSLKKRSRLNLVRLQLNLQVHGAHRQSHTARKHRPPSPQLIDSLV